MKNPFCLWYLSTYYPYCPQDCVDNMDNLKSL